MKNYDELIVSLIDATNRRKIHWTPSSFKGGFISKIGNIGIEVLPPTSDPSQWAITLAATALRDSIGQEELSNQQKWRVIVYSSEGERDFIIVESRLDYKSISDKIGQATDTPIRFLFEMIVRANQEIDSIKIKNLIDKIKGL